jgi:hypothetical protein
MERLLVVLCPELLEEQENGRAARAFAGVVEVVASFSPAAGAVRPGVCAVPTRGPSRYFGGDVRLAQRIATALGRRIATALGQTNTALGQVEGHIGVADGLFAAVLAARAAGDEPVVVPAGGSAHFLAPWPVEVLERPALTDLLRRLGIRTLGAFADLPTRHVLGRLGAEGSVCHELARGMRSELPGYRLVPRRDPAMAAGGNESAGNGGAGNGKTQVRQAGFWGEAAAAEARAQRAVEHLEQLLPPDGVVVGRLQGGRGPAERARLVPWAGRRLDPAVPGPEPWPGQLPAPAPVSVMARARALVVDGRGAELEVSASGLPSAPPQRLSIRGGPWQPVAAWAGPWPVDERWWSRRKRRRRARMQLVTAGGMAYLVVREDAGWWVEGAYD